MLYIVKIVLSAIIIAAVSKIAQSFPKAGALIASLPLTTLLVLIWMQIEGADRSKISKHAELTFWYVLPTLPMFLLFPYLEKCNVNFWINIASCCILTLVVFFVYALIMKKFGIDLL